MRLRLLVPAVAAIAVVLAPPAGAATVSLEDGELRVFSAPGDAEKLSVYPESGGLGVSRLPGGAQLVAGPNCSFYGADDRNALRCAAVEGVTRIVASGGDGDDALDFSGVTDLPVLAFGGPGNDTFTGGDRTDRFDGGAGNDYADPGAGADVLTLGAGNDYVDLEDAAGKDVRGGADGDYVSLARLGRGVRVTLDGRPDDGVPGDKANFRADVESVIGTPFDDRLVGNAGPNELTGGDGDDQLAGGRGYDSLIGGDGADELDSGDGAPDGVRCSGGRDRALVDLADRPLDCERRLLAVVPTLVLFRFPVEPRGYRVRDLQLTTTARNARAEVRCTGRGCPFSVRAVRISKRGVADASKPFGRRVLRYGTVLEIRVFAANLVGDVTRLTLRRDAVARLQLCLPPGDKRPRACS